MASSLRSDRITPFWQCLPMFFKFGFQLYPLCVIAGASLMAWLLIKLFFSGTLLLLSALAMIVLIFFAIHFTLRVTRQFSIGVFRASDFSRQDEDGLFFLIFRFYGLNFVFSLVMGLIFAFFYNLLGLHVLAEVVLSVLYIYYYITLPAMTINLQITHSVFDSLSPVYTLQTIRTLGRSYVILFLMMIVIGMSLSVAFLFFGNFAFSKNSMVSLVGQLLFMAVPLYFLVALSAMMGYVMYQFHSELGIDGVRNHHNSLGTEDMARVLDQEVTEMIAEGDIISALELSESMVRDYPDDLMAHRRYHRVLLASDRPEQLLTHAQTYLQKLMDQDKYSDALKLLSNCLQRNMNIRVNSLESLMALASYARKQGQSKLAVKILSGFDRTYPNDARAPDAYLSLVQLLVQDIMRPDLAQPILRLMVRRYPQHPSTQEVMHLLQAHMLQTAPGSGAAPRSA